MRQYRLTPYDRARQRMMFADPQLGEPEPPLVFDDPQPAVEHGGSGWTAFLRVAGQTVWHCTHPHRSERGALTCAWRQRGVELQRRLRGGR